MDLHEQFTKIAYIVVNPLKCFCQSVSIHLYRWPLDRYSYVWTDNYHLPNYVERETLHRTKAVLMNNRLGKASGTKAKHWYDKGQCVLASFSNLSLEFLLLHLLSNVQNYGARLLIYVTHEHNMVILWVSKPQRRDTNCEEGLIRSQLYYL